MNHYFHHSAKFVFLSPDKQKTRTALFPLLLVFGLSLTLFSGMSGCRSGNPFTKAGKPSAQTMVLSTQATLPEIIQRVNQNVLRVDSFVTKNATLNGEGVFNLKGEIAFKRPNYFRLIGSHAVTGMELDIGRNADVMWMWVGKAEPKAMYYCRNSDYPKCESELNLSINPAWILDAMGFGILDPTAPYEGPTPTDDGRHLELRVRETTSSGEIQTKVFVISREHAMPAAVRIYDRFNSLIADARVKSFRQDSATGNTIPAAVEISCPKENQGRGMKFSIHYGSPTLNQLEAASSHLWTMPEYPGYPPVNMAQH
ncbi:MAG: hypothetical protein IJF17_10450 [Thermoguttaceae bacterium]|nr:hypothetical protein [Thermoguttaceae bacterium]